MTSAPACLVSLPPVQQKATLSAEALDYAR